MFKNSTGIGSLLKEGAKHYSGLEETILRNIEACKEIAGMTRTSLGPNGMNKMVINHLEKLFVTSDAATIVRELEVQHPAAKLIVMAAKMQEEEVGDATNLCIAFAGELLTQAEVLIKMGLHPSDIVKGYEEALEKLKGYLEEIVCHTAVNVREKDEINKLLTPVIASKQYGVEDVLTPLVAEACLLTTPAKASNFNVENIRVSKLLGGGLHNSQVVKGMIIQRKCESQLLHVKDAKIAVFNCPVENPQAETKGKVIINTAEELENFSRSEEELLESIIKDIADSGVNVLICGGSISDLALHFIDRYKLLAVKVMSKHELRRVAKSVGALTMTRLGAPTPEEMGAADEVTQTEISSQKLTIIRRDSTDNKLCTLLLRGSTMNMLDDAERAVDDAVNVMKSLLQDGRFVPGAGATEILLSSKLQSYASTIPGLSQYSINKFGEAFEVIPRTLAENSGNNPTQLMSQLYAQNSEKPVYGIDIDEGTVIDVVHSGIMDHLNTKYQSLRLATDAVLTVLRVDQMIMSKPAGGPNPTAAQRHAAD